MPKESNESNGFSKDSKESKGTALTLFRVFNKDSLALRDEGPPRSSK